MIEAGEIGAIFSIVDEASPVLRRLAAEFERLDGVMKQVKEAMATVKLPPGVNAALGRMNENLAAIAGSADKAATGAAAAFGAIDKSVDTTMERVAALTAEMGKMGKVGAMPAGVSAAVAAAGGGGVRARAGGHGGGGGGIQVFGGPGMELPGGGSAHVSQSSSGFWELVGGLGVGWGIGKLLSAGGELEKQKQLLRGMGGISEAEINKTVQMAQLDTQKLLGSTIAGNVKGMREMMGIMPNLDIARETYPMVFQAAKVLERLEGTPADKSIQTLAKMIELRGGGIDPTTHELSPGRFLSEADSAIKMIVASGGFINANKALQLMQQAGPMARMQTDADTFYKGIMTAVMDMSGNRAGTALTAVGRQLLGGQMTMPKAEELERLGILPPRGPTTWHKAGTGVYVAPGALKGEDIIKDPLKGMSEWFKDVLVPAMKAAGIIKNADVQQELYRAFGTETARRMAGLYLQNMAQISRDAALYDKVNPDLAYKGIGQHDYAANLDNLTKSIENFGQAVGSPSVSTAIGYMRGISSVLDSISKQAAQHQGATQKALEAAAGGALALGGAGLWKLGGGALKWLGVGGEGGFGGALAGVGRLVGRLYAPAAVAMIIDDLLSQFKYKFADLPTAPTGPQVLFSRGHAANALKEAGYTPESLASEMGREASRAKAYTNIGKVGDQIQGMIEKIPSQVQPAIANLASVGNQIAAAINGIAASARNAAAAIPTGAVRQAVTVKTAIDVSGRQLAEVVSYHQIRAVQTASNAGYFDGSSLPSPTDLSYT